MSGTYDIIFKFGVIINVSQLFSTIIEILKSDDKPCLKRTSYPHVLFPSYHSIYHSKFVFNGTHFMLLALILESIYLLSSLKVKILFRVPRRLLLMFSF